MAAAGGAARKWMAVMRLLILALVLTQLTGCAWMETPVPTARRIYPTATHTPNSLTPAPASVPVKQGTPSPVTPLPPTQPVPVPTARSTSSFVSAEVSQPFRRITELGSGEQLRYFLSPDGSLAAVCAGEQVLLMDTAAITELYRMAAEPGGCSQVTFSRTGVLMAVQGETFLPRIYNLVSREWVSQLTGDGSQALQGLVFSPDLRYLVYQEVSHTSGRAAIRLWDIEENRLVQTFPAEDDPHPPLTTLPAMSPNGQWVAAGHAGAGVSLWNTYTGELRYRLEGHAQAVSSVDFSPEGRYLASGSEDGTVRIWELSTGRLVKTIGLFLDDIHHVKYTPEGNFLRVKVSGQPEWLVDVRTSQRVYWQPALHSPDLLRAGLVSRGYVDGDGVLFSPDGRSLVWGDLFLQVWDLTNQEIRLVLDTPYRDPVAAAAFSPGGELLAVLTTQGSLVVWDMESGERLLPVTTLQGDLIAPHTDLLAANQTLAFSPDGAQLAFGRQEAVEIWAVDPPQLVRSLDIPPRLWVPGLAATGPLAFSSNGRQLYASANQANRILAWDVNSGVFMGQVSVPAGPGMESGEAALAWPWLARSFSSQEEDWIELRSLDEGQAVILDVPGPVTGLLRFSSGGSLLATASSSQLLIWQTGSGELLHRQETGFSGMVEFDIQEGNQAVAISQAGRVSVWDISSIAPSASLPVERAASLQVENETLGAAQAATFHPRTSLAPTPTPSQVAGPGEVIGSENAAQLVQVGDFGRGTVEYVQWRSDGKALAAAGSAAITRYALTGAGLLEDVRQEPGVWTQQVRYLPDGRLLAAGTQNGQVWVWNTQTGQVLFDELGSSPVLSSDGNLLSYVDSQGRLLTWDLVDDRPLAWLHSSSLNLPAVFSPDGQWVAAAQHGDGGVEDTSVRVWDTYTGEILWALGGPESGLTSLAFSSDGKFLVGAAGGAAWWWQVQSGEAYSITVHAPAGGLELYEHAVTVSALSPNNRLVAVGDSQHNLYLVDRLAQKTVRKLTGHASPLRQLYFNPQGTQLLSVDWDGALLLWQVDNGKLLGANYDHTSSLNGLAFRQDDRLAAWQSGASWLLQAPTGKMLSFTRTFSGTLLAASPAGDWLAVQHDQGVSLWDARTGSFRRALAGDFGRPWAAGSEEAPGITGLSAVVFNPTGKQLALAGTGGVWVYDTATGSLLHQLTRQHARLAAFTPDGRRIVISADEKANQGCLYDLVSGQQVFEFTSPHGDYTRFSVSADGLWLGALSRSPAGETYLEIWSLSGSRLIQELLFGAKDPPVSLAFSPSAQLIALGRTGGELVFFDLDKFRISASFQAPPGSVEQIAFSRDGLYLAASGRDGVVRLWGVP